MIADTTLLSFLKGAQVSTSPNITDKISTTKEQSRKKMYI